MNDKGYSVLMIGNFESVYVVEYVKHLKQVNPHAHISFWGYTHDKSDADRNLSDYYDECCFFNIRHLVKSSMLWQIKAIKELRKSFRTFVAGKHFDYISVQYIKPEYCFLVNYFKKSASKLVITPWGSDVYGIGKFYKHLVKIVFDKADYVTGPDDRFTRDFTRIFNVPARKIVHCDLGVAPIDYIIDHKGQIDSKEAKHQLGVDDSFVITCGYNANPAHQHLKMIDVIQKVKDELPQNLVLFFPLTYPNKPEYKQIIKQKVKESGLKAVIFDQFLDVPHLFLLRQATDLFIHIQSTDASSGTLYEYILCEKKILNGAWLKYPEIEINGKKPYYTVDTLDNLGQAIINTYKAEPLEIDKQVLADLEKKQWKVVIKGWDDLFSNHRLPLNSH
jgi:hypothetical protein